MTSSVSSFDNFSQRLAAQKQRENDEIESLHREMADSTVPMDIDLMNRVSAKFGDTAQSILRNHAGYRQFRLRESYLASSQVFDAALDDLLAQIAGFEKEALREETDLFDFAQRHRLEAIELRIQKELFAATNAALSLVDHSRRLQNELKIGGYADMLKTSFKDDGLHDFITGLRVLLHHLEVVKAGWLRTSALNSPRTATFTLAKAHVSRTLEDLSSKFSKGQIVRIRACLANLPEEIDLAAIFTDYGTRSRRFNSWLQGEIVASPPKELADYDRCQLAIMRRSVRMTWNAVLGNWLQNVMTPHVHRHLPKFLDASELSKVYALPLNSPEQADKVLEIIDTYGAADDALRDKVRHLFSRATNEGAPEQM